MNPYLKSLRGKIIKILNSFQLRKTNVTSLPITITARDIADLFRYLNSRRNKDRDHLCLNLSLIRKNIREWYKEILKFAKDEMGSHLAREGQPKTSEEISNMVSTLLRTPYVVLP
jgi:hypothetical protein